MDIHSKANYPSSSLSNFAPHPFVFDGVECNSMEGFLQSLKFKRLRTQTKVCKLIGNVAKRRGQKRNKVWERTQTLWWKGKAYDRHGEEYQALLDRAYDALAQNISFQKALLSTGDVRLTHSVGDFNNWETCLTEREFISRLERIRTELQNIQPS